MQRKKFISAIFRGELFAVVKRETQWCAVRLDQNAGSDHLPAQVRMAVGQARVVISTHVIPPPAVEAANLHLWGGSRDSVFTNPTALVVAPPPFPVPDPA